MYKALEVILFHGRHNKYIASGWLQGRCEPRGLIMFSLSIRNFYLATGVKGASVVHWGVHPYCSKHPHCGILLCTPPLLPLEPAYPDAGAMYNTCDSLLSNSTKNILRKFKTNAKTPRKKLLRNVMYVVRITFCVFPPHQKIMELMRPRA